MKMSCMKCGKVLPLEVTVDEGDDLSAAENSFGFLPDKFEVDIASPPGGILLALCMECISPRQAHERMMQLASAMLETNEAYIEQIEATGSIVPALLDDAKVQASLAQARERVIEARAWMQALLENEPEDE
jgi:hypothetical protein